MEMKFKKIERWLTSTLKSIGYAVIATDTKGYVRFINPVAQSLTGWKREDAIGKPLKDVFNIINEETGKPPENPVTKVIQEGAVGRAHHILIAKDGTETPVDESTAPIKDEKGNMTGVIFVFHDITERRQAEEALQKSKESFQAIVTKSTDGILVVDHKGVIHFVNPAAETLLGRKAKELVGSVFGFPVMAGACSEVDIIRKGGEAGIAEMRLAETDWEGKPACLALLHDITERKQMEETIRKSLHRSEFLLDLMSHDLTNVNQITLSSLELILVGKDLSEQARRYSELAMDQIHRSAKLISNVKKLVMLTKEKPHLERVDIEPVLESAISHLKKDFPQRDIEINFKPQKGKWFVGADESLYELFYNILHNAVKFDRHEKVIVDVKVSSDDDFWRAEFRDRGPGIPDENKKTLFLRAQWEGKIIYGLGLGLALVRAIIESYGGKVWVEDRVKGKTEKGSNFIVLLPKAIDD